MARLHEPTLKFTIPSQQDGVTLECRIYHPSCIMTPESTDQLAKWRPKAAIVAHPYTTLGGCMDDPVVDLITSSCLSEEFVVLNFNFRGAGGSEGYTSWKSKSEQSDYKSFVGFIVYYIHHLCVPSLSLNESLCTQSEAVIDSLSSFQSQQPTLVSLFEKSSNYSLLKGEIDSFSDSRIRLLLSGYSYGSLVTMSLPANIQSILAPFQTPSVGSNFAKIRQKAESLATEQKNLISKYISRFFQTSRLHLPRSFTKNEIPSSKIRDPNRNLVEEKYNLELEYYLSHYLQNSPSIDNEGTRESIDHFQSIDSSESLSSESFKTIRESKCPDRNKSKAMSCDNHVNKIPRENDFLKAIQGVGESVDIAYLLVSPLQGIVCGLLTLWTYKTWKQNQKLSEFDIKLKSNPTLAIFGDKDLFVSAKQLREWANKLADNGCGKGNSHFRYIEVMGASHFWNDRQHVKILLGEIKNFCRDL